METEHVAIARGFNLPVSMKFSVEVASFIRGRNLDVAKKLMAGVIETKVAVPLRRFNRDQAHKRGPMAAGRYPVNVAKEVLRLLESAEMNAINKGLDVDALFVSEVVANKGTGAMRYGRHRGRSAKRTHIEIVLEEREQKKKAKKETKKPEPKKEVKAEGETKAQ